MKARIPGANHQSQAAMMKQVQKMQEDMANFQTEFESREFTAVAGGGIVEVTMTGNHEMKKITIDPEAVDPEDIEMLEDMILAALNDANQQADKLSKDLLGPMGGAAGLF